MANAVDINNLSFEYEEGAKTIDDISFSVPKGSYTVVLGHNGSGKSTIAKLIIGLLEPKTGDITVDGIHLDEEHLYDVREKVGIVFQNPDNQFIGSTVRDDIAFGLENLCVPTEEMENIIQTYAKKVNMTEFLDHEPTKLSGGQKQRVAIAGILAMHPSIIILDEATSMLDPRGKIEINNLVHELNKTQNMTILSITHDIEEAALSDHVILLDNGHIIDEDRRKNAEMMENSFYNKENLNPQMKEAKGDSKKIEVPDGVDAELLMKVLANPEMAALLNSLAKTMK